MGSLAALAPVKIMHRYYQNSLIIVWTYSDIEVPGERFRILEVTEILSIFSTISVTQPDTHVFLALNLNFVGKIEQISFGTMTTFLERNCIRRNIR